MSRIGGRILLAIFLFMIVSCEKNDTNEYDGKVVFYTNAQALLNCGAFDIYVYVDSIKVGTLNQPLLLIKTDPQPNCGDPLTLTIKKNEGNYVYFAEGECGLDNLKWEGEFQIVKDSCTRIFFDLSVILDN